MKYTIILGNFITMDEKRPFARAALAKDGVFAYIGSAEEAKRIAGADAQVLDYGKTSSIPASSKPTLTDALPVTVLSDRRIS